jgi:hypothetical protein
LAVPRLKYASDGHDLPLGYIYTNVYTFASAIPELWAEQRSRRDTIGSVKFGELF